MNLASLQAPLPAEWYWQPAQLERERERIFKSQWLFAGFAEDLAKDNSYIAFSAGGIPVVVRRMKGRLVAFRNVCSHRHSLIHAPGKGIARFSCLYHGWTYDAEGVPIGVPDNAKSFGLSREDKCARALEGLQVDQCGRFIFVRFAKQGPTLREWLGDLAPALEHISQNFDTVYADFGDDWACNWKLGLEITLEGYHLPVVHPSSFAEHIGGEEAPSESEKEQASDTDYGVTEYVGPHSTNHAPLAAASLEHLATVAERLKLPVSDRMKGYDHYLIYPNLMIGINGGTNACVERYDPVAPDATRVECWLMTGTPKDEKLRGGLIWQTITKQWADWTKSVLAEDRFACEAVQKGVAYARNTAILGRAEDRVRHYQKALCEDLAPTEQAA